MRSNTNQSQRAKPRKGRLRILMVDDSSIDAELHALALEAAGYTVEWEQVQSAGELQAALDRGGWDVVLSDNAMPEFDGLSALAMVKARQPNLPGILVTGTLDKKTVRAALAAGARDCVQKGAAARLVAAVEQGLPATRPEPDRLISEE